jgi:putative protease
MQPVKLELLAPAKNKDIGIAAIDCGADAVYIAGPSFGARVAAGNPVEDIAALTAYAHKFSARIYATVNTIVFENELESVRKMIWGLYDAGVDALIVQDLGITRMDLPPIELHASTQCAIRTPEQARMLESLGFTRLILERQLALDEIRAIRAAVGCELEFFVHGAICVSYSGNCYLSQYLAGRSANRGACIQACRSLYDVVDGDGNVLRRDAGILSPKDYCLDGRLEELADAGICSFKVEGRLKNESYVKNLCRHYRGKIDEICARRPEYVKASSGILEGGFTPNPSATFNRGYTNFFIDGKRARWNSPEGTKSIGEYVGTVMNSSPSARCGRALLRLDKAKDRSRLHKLALADSSGRRVVVVAEQPLSNGDGLVFVSDRGLLGMRADVVKGDVVMVKDVSAIAPGDYVYRNYNIKFEKELETNMPRRKIDVEVVFGQKGVTAIDADGFKAGVLLPSGAPDAEKQEAAVENIRRNMGKRTGHFDFKCTAVEQSPVKFYPAAALNALRRDLAEELERQRLCNRQPLRCGGTCFQKIAGQAGNDGEVLPGNDGEVLPGNDGGGEPVMPDLIGHLDSPASVLGGEIADYHANCANHLAREVLTDLGFKKVDDAYELKPVPDAELMRSRYCVKYELGLCPRLHPAQKVKEPIYLLNGGTRLKLSFDCKRCEMIVSL